MRRTPRMMGRSDPFGDLDVTSNLTVPAKELSWKFSRSSGPGGQGVNTADSRVELSVHLPSLTDWPEHLMSTALHRLSGRLTDGLLTVTASEYRQQIRNREAARMRLAALLRAAVAPPGPVRRPTRPTAASRRRRLDGKRRRSETKQQRRPASE